MSTPFEQRPIGLELSLCQRYFERMLATQNSILEVGVCLSSTYAVVPLNYIAKRGAPTVAITSELVPLRTDLTVAGGTWIAEIAGVNNARLATSAATGLVAGNCTLLLANAGGQYIDISAEL